MIKLIESTRDIIITYKTLLLLFLNYSYLQITKFNYAYELELLKIATILRHPYPENRGKIYEMRNLYIPRLVEGSSLAARDGFFWSSWLVPMTRVRVETMAETSVSEKDW